LVAKSRYCARKNEIFVFSKPRPVRTMHKSEGWTPQSIADDFLPAARPFFSDPAERSGDVFGYDPI
jgi:hypothetical protein